MLLLNWSMVATQPRQAEEAKHWSEMLAEKLIAEKKGPYVISGAATLSGPIHIGTICEPVYSAAVAWNAKKMGKTIEFVYGGDTLDAFDAVPAVLSSYEKTLAPHLGKPLCEVPDPYGCCGSYAKHFLNDMESILSLLDIHPKIIEMDKLYKEGKFDVFAKIFLENFEDAKEIVATTSLRELPKDWNPIMPICQKCGKIATTAVTSFDTDGYEYSCSKDVKYTKGCGFSGKNKISDHKYKITWRLHWPSWTEVAKTSIEGAGVDHHTRGGSWDTLLAVYEKIFKKEPPMGFRYGWFFFQGKKFSKSAGRGAMAKDILSLIPPQVVKYFMLRADIQENRDFDPTGNKLLDIYRDYEHASELKLEEKPTRADEKRRIAYLVAGERTWKTKFLDALLYYQIYRDWNEVASLLDDKKGVKYLSQYIQKWVDGGYPPEEYLFKISPKRPTNPEWAAVFAGKLSSEMDALDIHNLVFDTAKELGTSPEELFGNIYTAIIGKEKGPRMGKLIKAIGVDKAKEILLSFK